MKYNSSHIRTEATQIKKNIEQNRKIPKACTLTSGAVLSPYSVSYLMAKIIQGNFKKSEVELAEVIVYNADRHKDTINEQVKKDDYLKMIDNFISFCKEHRRVPAYITTQKSRIKVSFELFMYGLAKIIVFHQENKHLPNYCTFTKGFVSDTSTSNKTVKKESSKSTSSKGKATKENNCTNPYKSKPYTTKQGCDELGQNTKTWCALSALQKILRKFGINVSQKELARAAGSTSAGTSHQGIETAVAYVAKKYGVRLTCKWYSFQELGWEGIGKIMCQPNKDLLYHLCYRLLYGHYEKAAELNTKTGMMKIMNSLGNKCSNGCFCGYIENRSTTEQKKYMNAISQKSILVITKG